MERVKREADCAVAKGCWRWNRTSKARRKGVNERPTDDTPVAGENVTTRVGQKSSVVVVEDSVVPLLSQPLLQRLQTFSQCR